MRSWALGVSFFVLPALSHATHCELFEDSLRIPHAKAATNRDATYCFGYLHGRDRAWQMDYFRRTTRGENAEVHGLAHIKGDLMMRLLDLPTHAERLWEKLSEEDKRWLKDYAAGVNHGFRVARQQPSKEFRQGYPFPEAWKPQHSLALLLLQSFDQTRKTFSVEWDEAKARMRWGDKVASLHDPDGVPWDTTVLKKGEYPASTTARPAPAAGQPVTGTWQRFPTPFGEESGSNNWAVAPSRSRSGHALLANDPHLDLKTPMFWHWVHIESPDLDVVGASLPGIPVVVSGSNRKVSWGLTNAYVNTADIVRLSDAEAKQLKSFRPWVWVKWGFLKFPFFFKSFERTPDHLPVLPIDSDSPRPLVLKWSGFHLRGEDVAAMRRIMQASSAEEAEATLSQVGVPAWNFVFADVKGKIGHRVVGRGIRTQGKDAFGIREGTLAEASNPDFLTPEEIPHVFNPKRGYVATANNRHWPADSSLYGGRGYAAGFRAWRLDALLEGTPKHDVESFRRIQCDTYASDGQFLAPLVVKGLGGGEWSADQKAWIKQLENWDFSTGTDCAVCGVFRRVLDLSYSRLMVEEIGFWRLGQENHEEWRAIVQDSFKQAWKEIDGRKWGEVHKNPFPHLSGRKEWAFSPVVPTPGDKQTLNPGSVRWNEDENYYEHHAGASERLIVEMKPTPELWLVLPGLNSRYDSHEDAKPWQDWVDCKQHRVEWPVAWGGKRVERVEVEL